MSTVSIAFLLLAAAPAENAVPPAQPVLADSTAPATPVPAPMVPATPGDAAPPPAVPASGTPDALPGETPSHAVAAQPGDIVVSARAASPTDPLAAINVKAYEAIQAVDNAVVGPVAKGYEKGVPGPIRSGLRNFLRNLDEPVSFVNYLLQLKPGRAVKSLGRFAVNSTLGVAGLIDVAKKKPFNLPYRPNGFANTFACYGIGNGPYFFVPLAGPITLRDLVGLLMDKAAMPMAVGKPLNRPYYAIPAAVVDSLNDRIEMDSQLQRLREESPDPYVATRDLYLKQRKAEIAAICPKKGDAPVDANLPARVGKGVD